MELTKEHFDKTIQGLATKADLQDLEVKLVTRIDESQEQLARMTKRGFDDVTSRLDVGNKITELEHQMDEVRRELNLA